MLALHNNTIDTWKTTLMCEHIGACFVLSAGLPRSAETDQTAELQRTSHAEGKPRGQGRRQVQGTTSAGSH